MRNVENLLTGDLDSLWPSHSVPLSSNFPKRRLRMNYSETQTVQYTVSQKESMYLILI